MHCIAYYDGKIRKPKLFESKVLGRISHKPRGSSADHHWSRLFEIYIPDGTTKTLAQMSMKDYINWHDTIWQDNYSKGFAEWYLKRK